MCMWGPVGGGGGGGVLVLVCGHVWQLVLWMGALIPDISLGLFPSDSVA